MKITLKDGTVKEYEQSMSIYDIAKDISDGLARVCCGGLVDGEKADLRTVIDKDCELQILTPNDELGLAAIRHTGSHVLAQAVKRLYPDAKLAIGPYIDNGFYYDIEREPFSREDLDKIEAEMKKIVKEDLKIERFELPRQEAIKFMEEKNEPYKVELINDLPEDAIISFYKQGEFTDLCAGFHIPSTKGLKAFKLISSSMAYWRGDSSRPQLQRIYGTAFNKKEELEDYLKYLEEIKKRDHNKLGREMELFTTVDVIGQGLPLFLPNGTKMINKLQRWIEDLEDNEWGYVRTKTPLLAKSDLYKISGHWDHYKDGMFILGDEEKDKEVFALRPMTCPFQYYAYKNTQKSYRDLPYRMAETSILFRNEDSGEMHGLTRVRGFTQDDAHLFCTPDQLLSEFEGVIDLVLYVFNSLGFADFTAQISLRDPENKQKYIGSDENWEKAENAIITAAKNKGLNTVVEYGEAAFYGPKLDFMVKDALGRSWQLGTIQVDYNLPERFDLWYTGSDNEKHRPVMIHRAPFGSMERFIAILLENTAGDFPLWLAPEQFTILPISEKYVNYAEKVSQLLEINDICGLIDKRNEKTGKKIRDAELNKLPFMLVVGENEEAEGTVSVRKRGEGDLGTMSIEDFIAYFKKEAALSSDIK
mgnify:CR=1 FL=1